MSQPNMGLQSVRKPISNDPPCAEVFSDTTSTEESTESSTADDESEYKYGPYDSTPTKESKESSTVDDETEYECARDEDTEITFATLTKKVKKCKQRNKELSLGYKEQQSVLLNLQHDYAIINLKLAEVQTELDSKEMMTQELIASRDLRLLELVKERDDLANQVRNDVIRIKQKNCAIARLEDSLQRKELGFLESVQERVNVKKLEHVIKEHDTASKEQGIWDNVEENIVLVPSASGHGHWLRKNLLMLSPAKRKMMKEKVVPVDG